MQSPVLIICVVLLIARCTVSFYFKTVASAYKARVNVGDQMVSSSIRNVQTHIDSGLIDRKKLGATVLSLVVGFGFVHPIEMVSAADSGPGSSGTSITYKSGKTPDKIKNSDSSNKKGTRKETSFLRCMSNCKSDCQKPGEGLAKSDCNQDCQDQCCASYEQCSFKIRIKSNDI